jgi:hypothetical protein
MKFFSSSLHTTHDVHATMQQVLRMQCLAACTASAALLSQTVPDDRCAVAYRSRETVKPCWSTFVAGQLLQQQKQ